MSVTRWLLGVAMFFLTHEALQWSWTLARHALWMRQHSEYLECKNLNCGMTAIASVMAGLFSASVGLWFLVYSTGSPPAFYIHDALIGCGIQLSHIHFMALLARCTELPVALWPLLSRFVSRRLIPRKLIPPPSKS